MMKVDPRVVVVAVRVGVQSPEQSPGATGRRQGGEHARGGRRRRAEPRGGIDLIVSYSIQAKERRGAVYMYEVVRVHVKMCAVGARARAVDFQTGRTGERESQGAYVVHVCIHPVLRCIHLMARGTP